MSNNPNKRRMTDEEFEQFYADIYKEFGPKDSVKDTNLVQDVPVRGNPGVSNQTHAADHDDYNDGQKYAAPVKKEKGVGGLVVLICLELLGIAGVAVWWILRLL